MTGAFDVRCSQAVAVRVSREMRVELIHEAVAHAERLGLGDKDWAIFDVHQFGVKIAVRLSHRLIYLITVEEAEAAGLPNKPPLHLPN